MNFPPSEKLSGVKFKIPIIIGVLLNFKPLNFFFLDIFFKSFFILFCNLNGSFFISSKLIIFSDFLVKSSIDLNFIPEFPFKGKWFFFILPDFEV